MIAAPAPTILDAAAATPAATPVVGEGAAGFDAILLLQGLAATTDVLDAATFEAADTADALGTEDGSDDDDLGDDIEASLAFLANLIATTSLRSSGDFGSGAGEGGGTDDGASGLPLAANDGDAGFASIADGTADKAAALLALTAVNPEPLEKHQAGDPSQNLAKAAEMLAQAQRPLHAESARPSVLTHARDARWADDFGARVSLMVRAGESTASLQLTPVDLGPVEVRVTVKDSQATIQFGAAQAETRALIEASLPKLRELLASQGFNLLDASVSSGFSRQQQTAFASTTRGGASNEAETATTEARTVRQLGLLDLYA
ncbi:MAG TPA: flagellar hook-length control protein FliK [Steroidobacteraceae bacterium]|nr:flagellar hook-length control protein FliK [Steroidobacteraceae bacterium]